MDLPTILNNKGGAAAAEQLQHQFGDPHVNGHRALSDTGSERGVSPHMSDQHPSRFVPRPAPFSSINMANAQRYTEPVAMSQQYPLMSNPYPTPTASIDGGFVQAHQNGDYQRTPTDLAPGQHDVNAQAKAFACSGCGKGFARRSDLARHERIHSGIRPHVCDFPGCNKQFIQRSALTVHARVHTGEKPHMCEHCTKPFSDSSSLARHRRIHSGKRPYKCPYADCQKTFTRRTTLTRHQAHHSGTVEEAAAATAAARASRPVNHAQRTRSDGGIVYSDAGSTPSTPSPSQRTMSMSPASDMQPMPVIGRHHSDIGFYGSGGPIPPHLRTDFSSHSPRSGSTSPSLSSYGALGSNSAGPRPSLTSHPQMYGGGPPPILEPPAHHEPRSATGSITGGSPHLSSAGWQSPTAGSMGSPVPNGASDYMYSEPQFSLPSHHMYYPNSSMRRPNSTEPADAYAAKSRLVQSEVWSSQM